MYDGVISHSFRIRDEEVFTDGVISQSSRVKGSVSDGAIRLSCSL